MSRTLPEQPMTWCTVETVPRPPRTLPLATREVIAGWVCAAVVLVLLVAGILGWL